MILAHIARAVGRCRARRYRDPLQLGRRYGRVTAAGVEPYRRGVVGAGSQAPRGHNGRRRAYYRNTPLEDLPQPLFGPPDDQLLVLWRIDLKKFISCLNSSRQMRAWNWTSPTSRKAVAPMLEASPGERLRVLRELLGLTQADLAEAAGLSQAWVLSVETGSRSTTDDGLAAIAEATGTPTRFFYARPSSVPLDSLRFRKLASASQKTTNRIHAFFGESFRVTEELLKSEKYPPPPLPYATRNEITLDDVEEFTAVTRESLRLAPDKPIPHLTRALERAGVAVSPIALPDLDGETQPAATGHFGVSFWAGIGEPALIGYFPGQQGDRDRFTLAHELGHCVLTPSDPGRKTPRLKRIGSRPLCWCLASGSWRMFPTLSSYAITRASRQPGEFPFRH